LDSAGVDFSGVSEYEPMLFLEECTAFIEHFADG
jgi:hypothetical protein